MPSYWAKISAINIFLIFFSENRLWHFMQMEIICMKCQSLFSERKKKNNIIKLSSAELAQRVVMVKHSKSE